MSTIRKWQLGLWLGASLAIVVLAFIGADDALRRNYSNIVQLAAAFLGALSCLRTAWACPDGSALRQVWALIAAGVLAWGAGQAWFWSYSILHAGAEAPYPSVADIGFLAIGPLFVVALLRFRHAAGLAAPPWGAAVALALLVLSAALSTYYNWEGIGAPELPLRLASIAYAVSDPLMLAVTVWVAFGFGRGTIARSWWSVVAGIACFLAGNQVYSYLVFNEAYTSGTATDALWPIAFGLIALGAARSRDAYADA
jgi:diguanylate cyclase